MRILAVLLTVVVSVPSLAFAVGGGSVPFATALKLIDAEARSIRSELASQPSQSFNPHDLKNYLCTQVVPTGGTVSNENGVTTLTDQYGNKIHSLSEYGYPFAAWMFQLKLEVTSDGNQLESYGTYKSKFGSNDCVAKFRKIGERMLGEYSCTTDSGGAGLPSITAPGDFAIQYSECVFRPLGR